MRKSHARSSVVRKARFESLEPRLALANSPPVAMQDAAYPRATVPILINVLANDSDPDGDSISIVSFSQGGVGAVQLVSGQLQYTSIAGYTGPDSVIYTISDGRGGIAITNVNIYVFPNSNPNRAPTAQADSATTPAGTGVTINVLANDSDPDGDSLTITSFAQPSHGSVASVSGGLRYTPTTGYSGADSFNYTISDGRGGSSTATVSLTVQPPTNQAPIAQADSATTQAATAVTINVLANDTDPNGDAISISGFTQPSHGTVASVSGGLRYTPTAGYSGADSFTYTIGDGRGGSATATVSITVQPPANQAPTAQADSATTQLATAVTINVLANDSDPNGDALSISSFAQASHGAVSSVSGGLRYTPATGFTGTDSFTYTITDGRGAIATANVQVTVLSYTPPTIMLFGGRLVVTGTSNNDFISITGTGNGMTGQYVVAYPQGSQTVSGVTGDIEINLSAGDDQLALENAFVNGSVTIDASHGHDTVNLGNVKPVSTRLDLNVALGAGNDTVTGQRLYVGRNFTTTGGSGDDQINYLGSSAPGAFVLGISSGGATTILGHDGNDQLLVSNSFIVGQWQLDGGLNVDRIEVKKSASNGHVSLLGGGGADVLVADTNYFVTTLTLSGGDDGDRLELRNSLGMVVATLDGGAGNDSAAVSNLTAMRMALNMGAQNDTADVRGSLFDEFFAKLGDGNDSLTMYGNLIRRVTEVDGGLGGDAFFDLGNSHLGGIRRLGLE
jgi:hypothetical protein